MNRESDPLWRLRHAVFGMGLALLASVLVAAMAGRVLGDLFGDSYERRLYIYLGLLAYVIAGAVVLFVRVAQHETRPVSVGRVALWLGSLWLWPALLLLVRRKPAAPADPGK
jgi:MFS family permease